MSNTETPLLSIENLSRSYGPGCSYCASPDAELERNYCPRCGTIHALRGVSL